MGTQRRFFSSFCAVAFVGLAFSLNSVQHSYAIKAAHAPSAADAFTINGVFRGKIKPDCIKVDETGRIINDCAASLRIMNISAETKPSEPAFSSFFLSVESPEGKLLRSYEYAPAGETCELTFGQPLHTASPTKQCGKSIDVPAKAILTAFYRRDPLSFKISGIINTPDKQDFSIEGRVVSGQEAIDCCLIDQILPDAKAGHVGAQLRAADLYLRANEKFDYDAALSWLQKAAEQGNVEAQYKLGWMFAGSVRGINIDQQAQLIKSKIDYKTAAKFFQQVLENPEAQEKGTVAAGYAETIRPKLGDFYYDGIGVSQDKLKAVSLWGMDVTSFPVLEKRANARDAGAQLELAKMLHLGTPVARSVALKWAAPLAESGHADAQYMMAILDNGDDARLKWLHKAAKQGNSEAQSDLVFKFSSAFTMMDDADPVVVAKNRENFGEGYYWALILKKSNYIPPAWLNQSINSEYYEHVLSEKKIFTVDEILSIRARAESWKPVLEKPQ